MQQTNRTLPRNQKTILQCVASVVVFALFLRFFWTGSKDYHLSTDLVQYSVDAAEDEQIRLKPDEATSTCQNHGFPVYKKQKRKVYDLVLLSTELDWLEIRLQTMSPFVDYFVIVESYTTFTGKEKPLHLQDNWDMLRDYHDKIIHRIVYDPIHSKNVQGHEDWFRNSVFTDVFPGLVGTRFEARDGDVLIVSDMDEIVRPGAMLLLRHCDIPARLSLRTDFYSFSFQWRRKGPQWTHPDATIYKGRNTILPNDLRRGGARLKNLRQWRSRGTLWNAGWHCSNCFSTIEEVRVKMDSVSDQKLNTPENRDAQTMIDRVRNGKDIYGRPGEVYERMEQNQDVPEFILSQNRLNMRFRNILDRDGEDAGFDDWEEALRNE